MKRAIEGWRAWFKALGDTARLMVTRDPFIDDLERSDEVSRQRFEASMREVVKHEGGITRHNCCPPGQCKRRPRCDGNDIKRPPLIGHATMPIAIASIRTATTPEPILPKTSAGPRQEVWHNNVDRRAQMTVEGLWQC